MSADDTAVCSAQERLLLDQLEMLGLCDDATAFTISLRSGEQSIAYLKLVVQLERELLVEQPRRNLLHAPSGSTTVRLLHMLMRLGYCVLSFMETEQEALALLKESHVERVAALVFLVGELQCSRILQSQTVGKTTIMDTADDPLLISTNGSQSTRLVGNARKYLQSYCSVLTSLTAKYVHTKEEEDGAVLLGHIEQKIRQLGDSSRADAVFPAASMSSLSMEQQQVLAQINLSLAQDFGQRKNMLLTRSDVSIGSILRTTSNTQSVSEVDRDSIHHYVQSLLTRSSASDDAVVVVDLQALPHVSQAFILATNARTSVQNESTATRNAVKQFTHDFKIPDRGGRAFMEQRNSMPGLKDRTNTQGQKRKHQGGSGNHKKKMSRRNNGNKGRTQKGNQQPGA